MADVKVEEDCSTPSKNYQASPSSSNKRKLSVVFEDEYADCYADQTTDKGSQRSYLDALSTQGNADHEEDLDVILDVNFDKDLNCDHNVDSDNDEMYAPETPKAVRVIGDPIMLSSDEEGDGEDPDVSLVCLKRPQPVEVSVECLDILEDDEEYPVCLKTAEVSETVSAVEKTGYVKEYIENEGLAVIHSTEVGLVLFHLEIVMIDGDKPSTTAITREQLPIGTQVSFYDKAFKGQEFQDLNEDGVILQAVAVWKGERPKHLMKIIDSMDKKFWKQLEESRKTFALYLRGEVFRHVLYVRAKGEVVGYLNENFGIIKMCDEKQETQNVFFHVDDVKIFRKEARFYRYPVYKILPVGLKVSVDVTLVHIPNVPHLRYQAATVFAGSWPTVPHPTLLKGGPGSFSSSYDIPENSSFYYLELALDCKLGNKRRELGHILERTEGELLFQWEGVNNIRHAEDLNEWRRMLGQPIRNNGKRKPRNDTKAAVSHVFKAPPPRVFKTKDEFDTGSEVANHGSYAGSISGSESASRTQSRASTYSDGSSCSPKKIRTWYNPEAYQFGGLRLKNEVKEELDEERYSLPSKRIKYEC